MNELDLIALAQRGDLSARNELVVGNMRFLHWHARRLSRKCWPLEHAELVAEGALGLMRAIELFDPLKGDRLSGLASWHIRLRMVRAVHRARCTVHVPETAELPGVVSLDAPMSEDGSAFVAGLPADDPGPEDAYSGAERVALVRQLADDLDQQSAYVVRRRLDGAMLVDIGRELGTSRERPRQVEAQAVRVLRRWVA